MISRLKAASEKAAESGGSEEDRISTMLTDVLSLIAEEPGIARTYYIEVYAAGQEAIEHRVAIQAGIVDLMLGLLRDVKEEDRFTLQATMGAIGAVITQVVSLGQTEHVVHLQPQLLKFVMTTLHGLDS